MYLKLDNTNVNINNKNEKQNEILNKTIQLSDVKRTNKKSKIPFDKNSNKKYKTTEINYKKSKSNQINSSVHFSNENNKGNTNTTISIAKKRKINHSKSSSMRGNINNDKRMYTQNNDNNKSYSNLNNLKRNNSKNEKGIKIPNKNRYQSVIKTERAYDKTKKFLDMSVYEGIKTEITSVKKGNVKFLNNNKGIKSAKNT